MPAKIGLEIHGYLTVREKLFCHCKATRKPTIPNTLICPVCTSQPGAKPLRPNLEAVKKVVAIASLLGCKIAEKPAVWQRKHYDWPDLPKGYQDTTSGAYAVPFGEKGSFLGIRIRHVHLEEDPAKWDPETGLIDYNRSGLPLVEIVTEPDFTDSKQVRDWLTQLLLALSYIEAIDREAGFKADINVSVSVGQRTGERVEIKNVSSISSIEKAIAFEVARQTELLSRARNVRRETRAYSEIDRSTVAMRVKEAVADYRYIPDPDLPLLTIPSKLVKAVQAKLPELPHLKAQRFVRQYGITEKLSRVLTSDLDVANFYEAVTRQTRLPKLAAHWVAIELLRILNWNRKKLSEVDIRPQHFSELLRLVKTGKLTELGAKRLLNRFVPKSFSPKAVIEKERLGKITETEIEKLCESIIAKYPKAVADYKAGVGKALHFLIGQVVRTSERRAESKAVREILLRLLRK